MGQSKSHGKLRTRWGDITHWGWIQEGENKYGAIMQQFITVSRSDVGIKSQFLQRMQMERVVLEKVQDVGH